MGKNCSLKVMAANRVINNLEERVRQLMEAHGRLATLSEELKQECSTLRKTNRTLEEENRALREAVARQELAEGLSGNHRSREKARARVGRLMREVDKCIALVSRLEDETARGMMKEV